MKHRNFRKKLVLNKKTIAHLSGNEMKKAYGGGKTKPPTMCDCYSEGCPTKGIPICTTF
jgi:hypothetical protein